MAREPRRRARVRCRGAVQGVGFRPTVYRLATDLGLGGWVLNDSTGVTIEVEGAPGVVERFVERLPGELPSLARLDELSAVAVEPVGDESFEVRTSRAGERSGALVPPDAALCEACRAEMSDPADRRYHYPFAGCAACGPRFSLVRSLPYDRERTSMACFAMCPSCAREYETPSDRRFHTEPVCCPACGPRLWLVDGEGAEVAEHDEALRGAAGALGAGRIAAVKGLGGFQLACRADDGAAVARLRERKRRPTKPLAIMAPNLKAARALADLGPDGEELLASPRSPIVLAPRRAGAPVADEVAPDVFDLGVMLPTTPLHVELFRCGAPWPLVMTSGNVSDEPICTGNREALSRLRGIADLFLLHDRDIARRVDDSVVRITSDGPMVTRRARGWVPEPLPLPVAARRPVLALGGYLHVTACVAVGEEAYPSQHVGDLDTEAARAFLREVAEGLESFLEVRADHIVIDHHPDYPSSWLGSELADARDARLTRVQHHLAHVAATLAEHGVFPGADEEAVGVALDGTGWGMDGTAWGGEWFRLNGRLEWERVASLEPLPLVGGERAVREPWRVAVAALERANAGDLIPRLPLITDLDATAIDDIRRLASGSWPLASGAGRVFEAAGALCGLASVNRWEAEAAVRLESAAELSEDVEPWREIGLRGDVIPSTELLVCAARRLAAGEPAERVARGVHETFGELAAELTARHAGGAGVPVAIGGGCFVNRLLLSGLLRRLEARGLEVLRPRRLPPGDGGLSYGQAVLAVVADARGN